MELAGELGVAELDRVIAGIRARREARRRGDFPRPRPDVDPERAVRQHAAPFFIALARCFQSREANPNGAQPLFTAHSSYLLSRGILGRGQVWLAEKDGGATRLYPLTDYEPRKGEALEQSYFAGGHGAAPVVPSGFPHRPDR